jgi:hypothetical protein
MLLLICCIKARNWNIQNFNFACGSIWLWNIVSDIENWWTEGVTEQEIRMYEPNRDEVIRGWIKL